MRTGVDRLVITNNVLNCFHNPPEEVCPSQFVVLDETGSKFGDVTNSRIEWNDVAHGAGYKGTRSRMVVAVKDSRSVQLDFRQSLLFSSAPIANGSASCTLRDGAPISFSVNSVNRGDSDDWRSILVDFGAAWTGASHSVFVSAALPVRSLRFAFDVH